VRRRARSRAGERGFTLVEVLVCVALLAIIGGAVGIVFSVGLRTILEPGASRDRLAAASDAIAVDQLLSADVHRATCIQFPSAGAYGGCATESAGSRFDGHCTGSELCIEWTDLTTRQCDVALYTLSPVARSEWLGTTEAGTVTYRVTATPRPSGAPGSWPVGVDVTVISTNAHLANPPTLSFDLEPLATEPWPTDPVSGASTSLC